MTHIETLEMLRQHYERDGVKPTLNEVQRTNYLDELSRFAAPALEAAAKQWIRQSRFFPAVSDLIGLLDPLIDPKLQAALAWSELEDLSRRCSSSYRSVRFDDPVMGECVKRVFGTWSRVVLMDQNDPMWATRRNQFLAIYPGLLAHPPHQDVVLLTGHHHDPDPYVVRCTRAGALPARDESKRVLAEVTRRFKAQQAALAGLNNPDGGR